MSGTDKAMKLLQLPEKQNINQDRKIYVNTIKTLEKATGQVLRSAKYRPTRVVVDAALRRIGKSRHGDHKVANIFLNFVNGFRNGFHQWIQRIFVVVVEAKNFFFETFVFKIWMHFTAL